MVSAEDMSAMKAEMDSLKQTIKMLQDGMQNMASANQTNATAAAAATASVAKAAKEAEEAMNSEMEKLRNVNKEQEDKITTLQKELLKKMVEDKDGGGAPKELVWLRPYECSSTHVV